MIVPTIITAIGLYFFFVRLKATGSILAMALGHTVLALPVVVIIMAARQPELFWLDALLATVGSAAVAIGVGQ